MAAAEDDAGTEIPVTDSPSCPDPAMGIRYHGDPGPLFGALAKAQNEYEDLEKSGYNDHKDYHYAKLEDLLNAVKPALAEHGLTIIQTVSDGPDGQVLRTILGHESGCLIESTASLPNVNLHGDKSGGVHAMGSAITYLRRYTLQSVLGISAETDDDGQRAQQAVQSSSENPQGRSPEQGKNGDKRWVFHPENELNDSQKDRLDKMGWRTKDGEDHWFGYFSPQEISRHLDSLEPLGEVTEG